MKRIATLLSLIFGLYVSHLWPSVHSLRCYVCNDCEIYYNETQLIECDKDDKCIKTIEAETGLVSRDCGDKRICTKDMPPPNPKRKSEKIMKPNKKSRKRRSPPLLSPETKTTVGPPPPGISSLHCCEDEDGCNASPSKHSNIQLFIFLPTLLVTSVDFN